MAFEVININQKDLGVQVVQMENKPILAKAMEFPRISQYPEEVKNTNTLNFVTWALDMLGVNHKEGGTGHHAAVYEFVNDNLGGYTYQELKQAISMYIKGEFNDDKLFVTQQFNAVVLGKILNAYDEHKKIILNKYLRLKAEQKAERESKEKELTPQEKMKLTHQGVLNCFKNYKETFKIIAGYVWVYDYLVKHNIFDVTDKEKKDAYKEAKQRILDEPKPIGTNRSVYKKMLEDVENNKSDKAIIEAKNILLKLYFDYLIGRYSNKAEELLKEKLEALKESNNLF